MAKVVSTGKTLSLDEYQKRRIEERKRKFILGTILVLIIFLALVALTRIDKLQVALVRVEGARVVTQEEIANNILSTLSGRYFYLFPKSNALMLPRSEIRERLIAEFPRLSSIDLSLDGAKSVIATVSERDPFALYCGELALSEVEGCYFLDENGFIFDEAPDFSGVVYFTYRREPPLDEPKGRQFVSLDDFLSYANFINDLKRLGFKPASLSVGEPDNEVRMEGGARLLWRAGDDLSAIYSNLDAFLNSPEIRAEKNFLDRVSSLDLRTEDKIFYRFNE